MRRHRYRITSPLAQARGTTNRPFIAGHEKLVSELNQRREPREQIQSNPVRRAPLLHVLPTTPVRRSSQPDRDHSSLSRAVEQEALTPRHRASR